MGGWVGGRDVPGMVRPARPERCWAEACGWVGGWVSGLIQIDGWVGGWMGGYLGDRSNNEGVHTHARIEDLLLTEPWIDDVDDSVNGERSFRDVSSNHTLSRAWSRWVGGWVGGL